MNESRRPSDTSGVNEEPAASDSPRPVRRRSPLPRVALVLALVLAGMVGAISGRPGMPVAHATAGGNLWLTGHDADLHCTGGAQCHYFQVAVNFVRGGSSLPLLVLDHGTEVTAALTLAFTSSMPPAVVVDPRASFSTTALVDSSGNPLYSAIVVASDSTCGGCDNNSPDVSSTSTTPDSDVINARSAAIAAFFNAGGGILGLAGASNRAVYYSFLPITTTAVAVTAPFTLTAVGVSLGLTDDPSNPGVSDINCCATHNSFQIPPVDSPLQVAETDSGGFAETLIASHVIIGGGGFSPVPLTATATVPPTNTATAPPTNTATAVPTNTATTVPSASTSIPVIAPPTATPTSAPPVPPTPAPPTPTLIVVPAATTTPTLTPTAIVAPPTSTPTLTVVPTNTATATLQPTTTPTSAPAGPPTATSTATVGVTATTVVTGCAVQPFSFMQPGTVPTGTVSITGSALSLAAGATLIAPTGQYALVAPATLSAPLTVTFSSATEFTLAGPSGGLRRLTPPVQVLLPTGSLLSVREPATGQFRTIYDKRGTVALTAGSYSVGGTAPVHFSPEVALDVLALGNEPLTVCSGNPVRLYASTFPAAQVTISAFGQDQSGTADSTGQVQFTLTAPRVVTTTTEIYTAQVTHTRADGGVTTLTAKQRFRVIPTLP